MQIFNQAKAAGTEVFKVLNREPVISYDSKGKTLDEIYGNIDIHDVHFSYPSRPERAILQGFSLSIPAGQTVAFVGSSGCGKSTIISLVARFYDPSKGEILIDNYNVKDLDLKFLRKNIGAVSQEPSLFGGTIKDNMKVGKMDAEDEEIQKAAVMANAHSFISQLPDDYSTEVGQRGVQLSGGQKQRIAIARAILKNPPILLLDEATSALDSESEKVVQDALDKAMQGRTVILIAHRLSTVINADMIAVVENGQVTETGTHRNLLDSSKFYNNLFAMQNLNPVHESRDTSSSQEPANTQQISPKEIEQAKEPREPDSQLKESPKHEEQERRKEAMFFRIWFDLNKRDFGKIALGFFAAALSGISKPIFGYFIITIGEAYYENDAKRKVQKFSIVFSLIGFLSLFSHTVQHYFFGMVGEKAMTNLRRALYSGVLRNEIAWFEKPENNIGPLTSRIINDTSMVKTIIADRMSVIVQCISSILIATIVSMVVNWRMGLVAWAVMPCHFIGGLIQAKSAKGFSGDAAAAHSELVTLASESSITELWTLIPTVISAISVLTPAFQTLDRKTEIEPAIPEDSNLDRIKGNIEFQNIKFNYPLRPEVTVLNNFSLQIEAGRKVAFVGPSGAGKSSVLALLLRFYDPMEGRILIDRKEIREYNLRWLRRQIGLVQQEPLLFSSSIKANICYGTDGASETEIVEVSREANIDEFISNLPDGYETVVGEKGCQLSGGQKQRIAIARTLLKRPAVLLLDEATSALDAESEKSVVSALAAINLRNNGGILSKTTQITVAHRLSTIINSDTIIVMDKGKIVEIGCHSALITASEGVYSRLYQLQNLAEE